ncbi:hypothetical protein GOB93_15605 [Acetobacter musti]|uniref:Transglycosylase SLT domain-containing protein n=1 Tax=Acetobacter musti TaxID=864732 RepID=A0ABX0JRF7_9PROT|nr:hypothetical protein [Acetobacter musti]NHN86056.1 hypothetical protein [Acetobacter musti]
MTIVLLTCGIMSPAVVNAQTINVPAGLPAHVNATYQELGLGEWTPDTTSTTQTMNGSGTVTSSGTTGVSDSDALQTMYQQSWGYEAPQNAQALGVNPSALAATCVVESGCTNLYTAGNGNTITGAFQMSDGTYNEALQQALASNPELASTITSGTAGQQDPATQAVAAAQYLKDAATSLQSAGIATPTALDARGYYNFGPTGGTQLAQADASTLMSDALPSVSQSTLAKNGITSTETVGEWRAAVAAKMGSAAYQPVLTS